MSNFKDILLKKSELNESKSNELNESKSNNALDYILKELGEQFSVEIKANVEVYEDDYEGGEGDLVNYFNAKVRFIVNNSSELVQKIRNGVEKLIEDELYFDYNEKYLSIYDDYINTNVFVNGNTSQASKSEIKEWKKGEINLYNANINIDIIVNGTPLSYKTLLALFPKAS